MQCAGVCLNGADACRVNRIVHPHRQRGNNRATAPFPCHRRYVCLRARRMSRKCAAGQAVYTEGLLPYPPGDNPWARHGRAVLHRLRRHSWCALTAPTHVACCALFLRRPSEVPRCLRPISRLRHSVCDHWGRCPSSGWALPAATATACLSELTRYSKAVPLCGRKLCWAAPRVYAGATARVLYGLLQAFFVQGLTQN